MTYLYLQYRNDPTASWNAVPDLTASFPSVPAGALPVQSISVASEPQSVTPGMTEAQGWLPFPSGSAADDHLTLHVQCPPIPLALEASILTFLINYKLAAYTQAKYTSYGQGGWITAPVSLIDAKERHGMLHLTFRLAAAMADALTNE